MGMKREVAVTGVTLTPDPNAASSAKQDIGNASLAALGAQTDAAYAGGASGSNIGILKALYARLAGVVLAAGSAVVGKVGIDQTTPGTTNAVSVTAGGAVGEVQASPTANTILDRLKAILTGIVLSTGANIIGRVGVDQTTQGTTNGVVVNAGGAVGEVQASPTANTVLDRLKTLLTGIILAAGTNLIGKVGIDQTTQGTTNAVVTVAGGAIGEVQASPTANTVLDRLKALLTGVILAAGTNLIGKVGIDQTTPGTTNAVVARGDIASGSTDSGNPVKTGGVYNSTPPTLTSGQRGDVQLDPNGGVRMKLTGLLVTGADGILNNSITSPTASSDQAANNRPLSIAPFRFNGTTWDRDRKPNLMAHLPASAASTNATVAKASAGDLFTVTGASARASICYLHIYDKATTPTVGTDVPKLTLPIPVNAGVPFNFQFNGLYFANGISYGFSTGNADNDSAAIAANDIVGFNMTMA